MRTRIKICGITRIEDALAAAELGCDAIGLNFHPSSPRYVDMQQAAAIARALPAFVTSVGLFVDADPAYIKQVLETVPLPLLQFHGDESPAQCRAYSLPYIKAVRVRPDTNLLQYAADYADARALLLDAYTEGIVGGTGQVFDWTLVPERLPLPVVLAGGLDAGNVSAAIRQVRPYAVDVSGGVEQILGNKQIKGIKDAARMAAFMRGVSNAAL